jgi:hypothetical protein
VIKLEEYAANVLSKDPPKVVIILLNFQILGEMEPTMCVTKGEPVEPKSRNFKDENFEPAETNNVGMKSNNTSGNKPSFYNNKDSNKPASAAAAATPLGASNKGNTDMFNGLKIFGISSLNPYQNK